MVVWNAYHILGFPSMTPNNIAKASLHRNGDIIPNPITVINNEPGKLIYPDEVDLVFNN